MFMKAGQLQFVYNFLGIPPEQKLSCPAPTSGKHFFGVDFAKASVSKNLEALGTMTLYVDDKAAASANFRTQSTTSWRARASPSDATAPTRSQRSTCRGSHSPVARFSR